jgi:hypothetical protein
MVFGGIRNMEYKRFSILVSAGLGLLLVSLSIHFGFQYLVGHNKWLGLGVGVLMMIVGMSAYFFGGKSTLSYMISYMINMVGVGLSITAYYVFKAYDLDLRDFLVAIVISLSMLGAFGLLTFIPFVQRHLKWVISMVIIISFVSSLILWISVESFTGLSFYYLNVIYFFMVAMIAATDSIKDLSREMAIVSFGSFVLVSIIVLIIFTEGEILSGVDFGTSPKSRKKRL